MSIHITHNFSALPFMAFFSCSFETSGQGKKYNILIYFAMYTHKTDDSDVRKQTNGEEKLPS